MSRRTANVVKPSLRRDAIDGIVMIVSGALYGCCFPPLAWRWLAWVVLIPAFVVLRRASPLRGATLAAILATSGALVTVKWLPPTVHLYFHQPLWLGWLMFSAVVAVMVAPPYAAFGALYGRLQWLPSSLIPVVAACAWVSGEFFRSHALTGNPWVLWGYSQSGVLPMMQIADVTGVYGVTWVLALASSSVAEMITRRSLSLRIAASAALCVAAVLTYGHHRVASIDTQAPDATDVLVIQNHLDLGSQWHQEFYGRNLDAYLRQTLAELQRRRAGLVVWPESAMTFFLEVEPSYQTSIGSVLAPFSAELVAGGPHRGGDAAAPSFYNSAFLIAPSGMPRARYDKLRLLPFAEYAPWPAGDLVRRDFGEVRQFTAAAAPVLLPTAAGRGGVIICNEALFPELARAAVARGAELLINLTNDTWVNDAQFSRIAFDMARFRAVEQRRHLIRASTAGPSAIIAPSGAITAESPLFTDAALRGVVSSSSQRSLYAAVGDAFAWLCVAVTAVVVVVGLRR